VSKTTEAAPNLRWKVLYTLAYTSGARIGELINLSWADIDFEQGCMHIQNRDGSKTMPPFTVKDKEARSVPLPAETLNILTQYHQEAPEGVPYILMTKEKYKNTCKKWLKFRKDGTLWDGRCMYNHVRREFKNHARRAGIRFNAKFSIHTFRKCCAQNWADYLPANVVKSYLGHSSIETTNRFYSIVDASHMALTKEIMDKLLQQPNSNDDPEHKQKEDFHQTEHEEHHRNAG
jgi:integrase